MLRGGWLALPKGKKAPSRILAAPVTRSGGDCGPTTAAWLLNEHGPALYRARSPETCHGVRRTLMQAWQGVLDADASGDEKQAFVHQRLEQVPQAMTQETLDQQVTITLQALLRSEEEVEASMATETATASDNTEFINTSETTEASGISESSMGNAREAKEPPVLPYWFLPTDWARLAEAFQVDFVLHGLPGTEGCHCSHCGSNGHVHVGPRGPGIDLCLHVGWRGAEHKKAGDGPESKLQDGDGAWGHWEPLGSGPIKAPLPRQKSILESDLDFSNLNTLNETDQANLTYQPWDQAHAAPHADGGVVENILQSTWALAGFNCVHITSCTCQPAACQPESTCQTKRLKDCCDKDCCDTERRVSDDSASGAGVEGKNGVISLGGDYSPAEVGAAIATQPTVSCARGRIGGTGAGARFSVMLEGQKLFEGVDLEDTSPLRQADAAAGGSAGVAELERFKKVFVEAVSVAAGIAPSRVRILDIGLPFEASVKKSAKRSAATAIQCVVSATQREASPKEPEQNMLNTPDTGAGVLRFLTEDGEAPTAFSALSPAPDALLSPTTACSSGSPPAPETPPRTAATPWQTPVDEDPSTPPPPDRHAPRGSDASGTNTGPGTVRVLAVLRELRPGAQDAGSEEPDAMMALELVVTELADPQSTLQQALRSSTDDRLERIWCPEAEGPCKGPRRASATTRARHSAAAFGTNARLRRAKGVG